MSETWPVLIATAVCQIHLTSLKSNDVHEQIFRVSVTHICFKRKLRKLTSMRRTKYFLGVRFLHCYVGHFYFGKVYC